MNFTADQRDALTELINIAFSRAAASLSELTGNRVDLQVPEVSVHPIAALSSALTQFVSGEVATVHQIFSGPVAGDAFMVLNFDGAVQLVELMTDEQATGRHLGASAKEVIAEVGNILLNTCLGVFGNLLHVRFSFSVPRLQLEDLEAMVDSLVIGQEELRHAMIVGARFRLRGSQVTGCLVLVLGIASLDLFLRAVETWAEQSVGNEPPGDAGAG